MDFTGVVSAEQSVVNQSDLSTQKKQDARSPQPAPAKAPEPALPPYLAALKERIQQIADRLKTEIEREPAPAAKSEKSSEYHKLLIDELASWKAEIKAPKPKTEVGAGLIGEMPVYPFNRSFMDVYYDYIQRIASGEDVQSEKMIGDLENKLETIGTGGAPTDEAPAAAESAAPAPAPMKTIDQVI